MKGSTAHICEFKKMRWKQFAILLEFVHTDWPIELGNNAHICYAPIIQHFQPDFMHKPQSWRLISGHSHHSGQAPYRSKMHSSLFPKLGCCILALPGFFTTNLLVFFLSATKLPCGKKRQFGSLIFLKFCQVLVIA